MYYKVKVKEKIEDEKGKLKKQTAEYLVNALSVTEVEATITKSYVGVGFDWEITSVSETKIIEILGEE